jgi:hypothetical protein
MLTECKALRAGGRLKVSNPRRLKPLQNKKNFRRVFSVYQLVTTLSDQMKFIAKRFSGREDLK